jgi:hypothetical protein
MPSGERMLDCVHGKRPTADEPPLPTLNDLPTGESARRALGLRFSGGRRRGVRCSSAESHQALVEAPAGLRPLGDALYRFIADPAKIV